MKYEHLKSAFDTEENAMNYLCDTGVFKRTTKCTKCRGKSVLEIGQKRYRCVNKDCRSCKGVFEGTFFENCKVELNKVLYILYEYLFKSPINSIVEKCGVSEHTAVSLAKKIRRACACSLKPESMKVGGPGVIVEIDETKMGKRKYNRGHRVEGVWCVAGIERTPDKKVFVFEVEDRKTETLKRIISENVHVGSVIYTDGWKGYKKACEELGFIHKIVNHSRHYKDPVTGVHTNTIEGINNGLKISITHRNRTKNIKYHLLYYIWKRQYKKQYWVGFINSIK